MIKNTEKTFSICTSSENLRANNQIGLIQKKPESEIFSSFQRKDLSDDSSDEENSDVDILGDDKVFIT